MMVAPDTVEMTIAPAPRFSWTFGGPSLATIYSSHYDRLNAVVDAARTGNALLLKLALAYHDEHGSEDAR